MMFKRHNKEYLYINMIYKHMAFGRLNHRPIDYNIIHSKISSKSPKTTPASLFVTVALQFSPFNSFTPPKSDLVCLPSKTSLKTKKIVF